MTPSNTSSIDQVHFLLTCISCTNHGKVDFGMVASKFENMSKNAAAKRFGRIKAHASNSAGPDQQSASAGEPVSPPSRLRTNKRKAGGVDLSTSARDVAGSAEVEPESPLPPTPCPTGPGKKVCVETSPGHDSGSDAEAGSQPDNL